MKITSSIRNLIKAALDEDCAAGDLTTLGLGIAGLKLKAVVIAKQKGVLSGLDIFKEAFTIIGDVGFKTKLKDGACFDSGLKIITIEGNSDVILSVERVALNFLSHLSGISTFTEKFVDVIGHNKIKIYDTRKTTPLIRELEKYAVKVGGGYNHRVNLSQALMIKDNHINIFRKKYRGEDYILEMVRILREKYPQKELVLEVHNLSEWMQAMKSDPDVVMFDNWNAEDIEVALKLLEKKNFQIEISGSIRLEQLERIINLGVDRISLGRITHSAPACDFSLEIL
ncbi:MAG: carboxylating nicotinate-nucleotide diphosphorylase [Candidatus Kaelpia imicola]|nr:carboxylating nicotinate-nucleotide diphosphorylase [Candidatus Kaelpia imicola]